MTDCYIHTAAALCAAGDTRTIAEQLFTLETSPLVFSDAYSPGQSQPLGRVCDLRGHAATRTNRLLEATLAQLQPALGRLIDQAGKNRVGVVIGTSTSGIGEGEAAMAHRLHRGRFPESFQYAQQELVAPARFVADALGVTGPAWTVSTACTSGAKAIASGARLLALDLCDLVVVGGADSLCQLTVQGFGALDAISPELCNPFSRNRRGINLGEGAALMVLTREPTDVRLAGAGESSDAHHISAPHPDGRGAAQAMHRALQAAALPAGAIDYLNAHGTATEQNDRMESRAIAQILGATVACGSTKALTGHTLGAAGALEAVFCWLTLKREDGMLPRHLWDRERCSNLAPLKGLGLEKVPNRVRCAMSNSFAFGGNNISLIIARTP